MARRPILHQCEQRRVHGEVHAVAAIVVAAVVVAAVVVAAVVAAVVVAVGPEAHLDLLQDVMVESLIFPEAPYRFTSRSPSSSSCPCQWYT